MRLFAALFLAALVPVALNVHAQCPGNAKAIPFRNINRHQMLVGVSVNRSGPYDFLLDTGTQITVLDRSLASELHISTTGSVKVAGVSVQGEANFAQLDTLQVGNHAYSNLDVLIYNMDNVHAAGFAIRGLLGEDFLSRFDVLIDNAHSLLCLDDTGALRGGAVASK